MDTLPKVSTKLTRNRHGLSCSKVPSNDFGRLRSMSTVVGGDPRQRLTAPSGPYPRFLSGARRGVRPVARFFGARGGSQQRPWLWQAKATACAMFAK